jgi:aspartate aminotransferase-like enzyme
MMPGNLNAKGAPPPEGLRERKQRETRQRIAAVALRLFLADGYDSTTLEAIAAAAGISRRTSSRTSSRRTTSSCSGWRPIRPS